MTSCVGVIEYVLHGFTLSSTTNDIHLDVLDGGFEEDAELFLEPFHCIFRGDVLHDLMLEEARELNPDVGI